MGLIKNVRCASNAVPGWVRGLACFGAVATVVIAGSGEASLAPLEIYPDHTRLRVGEQVHYAVIQRHDGELSFVEDHCLAPEDPTMVCVEEQRRIEAVAPMC